MTDHTIGIDISKEFLDAHRLPDNAARRFANTRKGVNDLIRWMGAGLVARIVFEATGRYHAAVERHLGAAGYPFVKVNPRQAKRFGEALGTRAKTDRMDAAMLARMGMALDLDPGSACPENLLVLSQTLTARRALIKDRTAAKNRAEGLTLAILRKQNLARQKRIELDIEALDKAIKDHIESDSSLRARRDILVSITGIADVTAAMLISDMPELGSCDHRQIASLAGLAPMTQESGTWRGRSSIRGGRHEVRQALYMPALVAMRRNPDLKAVYTRLIEKGKPFKVAITAVMRKLLVLANALLRDGRKWAYEAP